MLPFKSIFRAYFATTTRYKPTGPDSKPIQSGLFEAIPSLFQRLPLELIYEITTYLPPSSELALRHTNRWFYANAGPETSLVISDRVCNSPECRLKYICFLERDAESSSRQFACSVCVQLHPTDRFSPDELRKGPETRTCRRVWICEHRTLSLAEYRKVLNSPISAKGLVTYPYSVESVPDHNRYWDQCCTTVWTHRCFAPLHRTDDRTRTLCCTWFIPLSSIIAFGDALARGIESEPAELDFHICPHIKPKDHLTDLLARNIESQLTKEPVRRLVCKNYKARIWCFFKDGYFLIKCNRFLGYGTANDPSWSSQLPLPPPPQRSGDFRVR